MSLPRPDTVDALLLDLDDTILDDRSGILAAWRAVVELVCATRPRLAPGAVGAAIEERTGWYWSDPERERRGRLDLLRARHEIVAAVLVKLGEPDRGLAEQAAHIYTEHRERGYRLADGALEALGRLRQVFPHLALVTNGATTPQRAKLERFGLAPWFDHIQVEGEFGQGKPEPAVYHHVAAALGVAPARCLMVGDNFRCDVLGSLAVGMHAAWIDAERRGAPPAPSPRPHATLAHLADLVVQLGL